MASPNRRQITPAALWLQQLVDVAQRLTAAHYEMAIAVFRIGSANAPPSSAAATNNAAPGHPHVAHTDSRPVTVDRETGQADVSPDSIRARAYEIYERRGDQPGDAQDDWYRAEAELRAADGSATR